MALMVSNAADSDSWKKFNTLSVIYADGTIKDVITDNSFGGNADSYLYNATVSVKDYVVNGDEITLITPRPIRIPRFSFVHIRSARTSRSTAKTKCL